jgi:hypothetical protein
MNENVLRIFIALKNPSPLPGLSLRTLGPMASTLTITTIPRKMAAESHQETTPTEQQVMGDLGHAFQHLVNTLRIYADP